jgi:hypothetical protein
VIEHSVDDLLEQAAHSPDGLARIQPVRKAMALSAISRFHPLKRDEPPWLPLDPEFQPHRETIDPLLAASFWPRLDVVAAPAFVCDQAKSSAMPVDLIVRFLDGGDIGVGMLHTKSQEGANRELVMAELGAAVAMVTDYWRPLMRRCFVVWASPGKTSVEAFQVDQCISRWLDLMDGHRWMQKALEQEQLSG